MSDTSWEIRMDRIYQEKEQEDIAKREYCKGCEYRNKDEGCPYYDADEESWDYKQCFRDNDWWV